MRYLTLTTATFSIMTLSITIKNAILNDTQHNNIQYNDTRDNNILYNDTQHDYIKMQH